MGYEEGAPAFLIETIWLVRIPSDGLPDNQQDRDMIARELLLKFQMSDRHPLAKLRKAYMKFKFVARPGIACLQPVPKPL